ncbi:hypothetical protein [Desulforamulus aquiferis]|uniref:Uncharacterized protein n=1 Tax=Desulforamulus aquiferis TaxID=1397668 RepID=A0AAW7ZFW4_9FIRM|nr:hypothetical protein [Desulforamulus aquiferis]MDO7788231.1 hypothetical protein [Desulforamulus aquiferis]RYD03385.1 hypothetical protein N752_19600 [Desulforamulus aquiferis]
MENLIILAILWAVFRALANKAKGRMPAPEREEEQPAPRSYRLPQDLRGKWGPKGEEAKETTPPTPGYPKDVLDMGPPEEIVYQQEEELPRMFETAAVEPPAQPNTADARRNKKKTKGEEKVSHKCFDHKDMGPGMLRQGIILSEILGPPVARRKRNRYQ